MNQETTVKLESTAIDEKFKASRQEIMGRLREAEVKQRTGGIRSVPADPDLIEEIKAEYLDDTIMVDPDYRAYRLDIKGRRHYAIQYDNGLYYIAPSVTTIIHSQAPMSPYLLRWYAEKGVEGAEWIKTYSGAYGTIMHILWNRLIVGGEVDLNQSALEAEMGEYCLKNDLSAGDLMRYIRQEKKDIRKDIIGFIQWVQDYEIEPIAIEYPVIQYGYQCPMCGSVCGMTAMCCTTCGHGDMEFRLLYAGAVDLVCKARIDKKSDEKSITMVDYKSGKSFYEDHEVQLHAYMEAWNDMRNIELKVDRVYNLAPRDFRLPIGKSVTPYRFKDQTDSRHRYKFMLYLNLFYRDQSNTDIRSTVDIASGTVSIDTDVTMVYTDTDPLAFLSETGEF